MRPVRLVVEGFATFRARTEIDFSDADLFALVGPTGSGKSSIIDALTFALYGRVSRYDDARRVAPVISQSAAVGTVDLVFTVGERTYRAHREVARTAKGATTREARLESGDETLAGDANGVTAAVTDLLGLTFDQFTTCVVLPQGEFARFLHGKPKERRELLVQLLDLGVYGRMMSRARERAAEAKAQVELVERQLADLEPTRVDAAALEQRLADLAGLEAQLVSDQATLDRLAIELGELDAEARTATEQLALLAEVGLPDEVRDTLALVDAAEREVELEQRSATDIEAVVEQARVERAALPERAELRIVRERHDERARLRERLIATEAEVDQAAAAAQAAADQAVAAESAREGARADLDEARRTQQAHALALGLQPGDECPVCRRPVDEVPDHDLADLAALEKTLSAAEKAAARTASVRTEADRALALVGERVGALRDQLLRLDDQLVGALDPAEVEVAEDRIRAADDALEATTAARDAAADRLRKARSRLHKAETLRRNAENTFSDLRERVAPLAPPPATRRDLVDDWQQLGRWADEQRDQLRAGLERTTARVEELTASRTALVDQLDAACRTAGVPATGDGRLAAVRDAQREAQRGLDDQRRVVERHDELEAQRRELAEREQVSRTLGRLLQSDGFQQWLLDEAVEGLLGRASAQLLTLSRGQYSLEADKRGEFDVVDHYNADEVRPARTLSGGETFLASLAMALALADQIADLAVAGAARLESIFLDEGFGTLDPETLDVVVDAIESLGASGRTVGLVSHVAELAERVPVQFRVTKGPATSTVERVES